MAAQKKFSLDEIEKKLLDIKKYYGELTKLYAIKDDLVEFTDKEHSLAQILNNHIESNQNQYSELFKELENNSLKINTVLQKLEKINELYNFIVEPNPNTKSPRFEEINKLISDENLENISEKSDAIYNAWKSIFLSENESLNIVDDINEAHKKISDLYNNFFLKNKDNKSKADILDKIYIDFIDKYNRAISGYEDTVDGETKQFKSYYDDMKDKHVTYNKTLEDLKKYHTIVFGDDKDEVGIKKHLEERIASLKEIEKEAKKIIDLSSDAGLAGGFHQRGKKARFSKLMSLLIFVFTLAAMAKMNFVTIDWNNLASIDLTSIFVRATINIPFVWIAIVTNINLNKYSRLEEEYAHKESLARSFERYKTEIEKLKNVNIEESNELLMKLMKTNIEAFALNPAMTMEHAKSDMPSVSSYKTSPSS